MNIMKKFDINPTNEFHILRHFEFIEEDYKKTLLNTLYWYYDYSQEKFVASHISENDIHHALETIGTKFYKNIPGIENPQKLLKLIKDKFIKLSLDDKIHWIAENNNRRFSFAFKYDFPVGDKNVLSINKLSNDDKKKVKSTFRSKCAGESNVVINTVSRIKLQPTKMIYVEILETNQLPFLAITAFPECLANNIPDEEVVFVV